jgi:hypothetical protein
MGWRLGRKVQWARGVRRWVRHGLCSLSDLHFRYREKIGHKGDETCVSADEAQAFKRVIWLEQRFWPVDEGN